MDPHNSATRDLQQFKNFIGYQFWAILNQQGPWSNRSIHELGLDTKTIRLTSINETPSATPLLARLIARGQTRFITQRLRARLAAGLCNRWESRRLDGTMDGANRFKKPPPGMTASTSPIAQNRCTSNLPALNANYRSPAAMGWGHHHQK